MPASAPSLILSAFCAVMPSLAVMSSNWMPAVLVVASVLTAIAWWRVGGADQASPRGRPIALLASLALLLLWAAVASLWSFEVERALFLVVRLALLGLAAAWLLFVALRLNETQRARVAHWLTVGFAIGLALFLFERLTGSALHFLLGNPDPDRSVLSILNRGATGLALLVWPVTAILLRGRLGRWALLLPAATLILVFFSESQSALVATLLGLVVLLLALAVPRAAALVAFVAVAAYLVLAPPAVKLLQEPERLPSEWIDHSAKHRLHIWSFAAKRIFERPVLGWGFDASHAMPGDGSPGFENNRRPFPSHPHNAALQIWLELGAVGVALAVAFLFAVLNRLRRLDFDDRAAAVALFICGLSIAAVSYGIWQSQWLAALLGAAIAVVATRGTVERAP